MLYEVITPQGGEIEDYTINVVSAGANDAGILSIDQPTLPVT